MGEFQHSLFGCFDNVGLCIITYFVPCYTFGKNAEAVGDSCCLCGLMFFIPIVNIVSLMSVRGKVREAHNIDGSCLGDVCSILFCTLCSLVQEAQEVQGPGGMAMSRSWTTSLDIWTKHYFAYHMRTIRDTHTDDLFLCFSWLKMKQSKFECTPSVIKIDIKRSASLNIKCYFGGLFKFVFSDFDLFMYCLILKFFSTLSIHVFYYNINVCIFINCLIVLHTCASVIKL